MNDEIRSLCVEGDEEEEMEEDEMEEDEDEDATEINNDKDLENFLEGLQPVTSKGRVVAFSKGHYGNKVPRPKGVHGHIDEHPEGADRGGYVVYVSRDDSDNEYYYDEGDDEWRN